MTSHRFATSALVLFTLVGCKETVSSRNIRTQGIAMLTTVVATSETRVTVQTDLVVGGDESNTYVDLDSGDRIYAEADGDRQEMSSESTGEYEASFDGDGVGAGGTEYRVLLLRDDDDDAENNSGTLPEPFEITSDFGSTPLSRMDDDVVITWEPSGETDDMELEVDEADVGCIFVYNKDIGGDPGTYTIPAGEDGLDSSDSQEPETCDVEATLRRKRDGDTDSVLDPESYFRLRQVRTVGFVSAP